MGRFTELAESLRGRREEYVAPEPIGAAAFRYFALAVGDDNPVYWNREVARAQGLPDVVAPPTLVCETNQYTGLPLDEEGFAGHTWGLVIEGARQVRGGNSYTFHQPVVPDDVLHVTWEVSDVQEKTGGSGQALLVITSRATYRNQDGELLTENEETIVVSELRDR